VRVLVTGWPSFVHGEATAGDVLSMQRVADALAGAGVAADQAFSPVFRPGALALEDATPERYTHVVFACGPLHGEQLGLLHRRYRRCRRIAVGVSVVDPADPAVTGFDRVIARDGDGEAPDLCVAAPAPAPVPVAGVVLAPGQPEYGPRRRHDRVHEALTGWLAAREIAPLPMDTRLDTGDWRHCATPDQLAALLARCDVVLTTRLHGLVFGLRCAVPVLAVDPVQGGGKLSVQARRLDWWCLVGADELTGPGTEGLLDDRWAWCRSEEGRDRARAHAAGGGLADPSLASVTDDVLAGALR
jgi:hypothetical protein